MARAAKKTATNKTNTNIQERTLRKRKVPEPEPEPEPEPDCKTKKKRQLRPKKVKVIDPNTSNNNNNNELISAAILFNSSHCIMTHANPRALLGHNCQKIHRFCTVFSNTNIINQRSPLLNLPWEILNEILWYSTGNVRDKIQISLTCKHLARSLASTSGRTLCSIKPSDLVRQVGPENSSDEIMQRYHFLVGLESIFRGWNQEAKVPHEDIQAVGGFVGMAKRVIKYDWRLCSVCLLYRNTTVIEHQRQRVVKIVDRTDEWRCVVKKSGRGPTKKSVPLTMGATTVPRAPGTGTGTGTDDTSAATAAAAGTPATTTAATATAPEREDDEVLWICPSHKINPARMMQLRY